MIELILPLPPSTNELTRNTSAKERAWKKSKGMKAYGRARTEAYQAWTLNAGWRIRAQLATAKIKSITGPVEITLDVGSRNEAEADDSDNRIKATLDILKSLQVIEDDNRKIVRRLVIETPDRSDLGVQVKPWAPLKARAA